MVFISNHLMDLKFLAEKLAHMLGKAHNLRVGFELHKAKANALNIGQSMVEVQLKELEADL